MRAHFNEKMQLANVKKRKKNDDTVDETII